MDRGDLVAERGSRQIQDLILEVGKDKMGRDKESREENRRADKKQGDRWQRQR